MKLFILSLLFFSSCAMNTARQSFSASDIYIKGGIFEREEWDNKMNFHRFSWFREATLSYDILIHKLETSSPFNKWFTRDNIAKYNCKDIFITLIYTMREAQLNRAYVVNEFEKKGFKVISIDNFRNNLKAHYGISDLRLNQHKVYGLCQQTDKKPVLKLSFPGFYRRTIDPYESI